MKDNLRFSRNFRIRKSCEFRTLYQSGNKKSGGFYTAFFLPGKFGISRLGVVASKRLGNAVVRNRQKRLVREAFRKKKGEFQQVLDLVIVVFRAPRNPRRGQKELQGILEWLAGLSIYSG